MEKPQIMNNDLAVCAFDIVVALGEVIVGGGAQDLACESPSVIEIAGEGGLEEA